MIINDAGNINGVGKAISAVKLFCTNVPIHFNVFQYVETIWTGDEGVITKKEVGLRNEVKHTDLCCVQMLIILIILTTPYQQSSFLKIFECFHNLNN